jgi:hypothetical protein
VLELLHCAIRLVHVVIGDTEVGRDVRIGRLQRERGLVPGDGVGIAFSVEIGVAELHARLGILRILFGRRAQRLHAVFIERRGLRRPAGSGRSGRLLRHRRGDP